MAAAAATTTAAANAAATAAAEETARLQRELDEMTNWLRIAYTPQVIYPTPMDQREMDKWASHPRGRGEGWNWSIRTGPVCKAGDHARADLSTAP